MILGGREGGREGGESFVYIAIKSEGERAWEGVSHTRREKGEEDRKGVPACLNSVEPLVISRKACYTRTYTFS